MNKNNIKIITIAMLMVIMLTACTTNRADEISSLFSEVYYPIANKKVKHDRDTVEKYIGKTDFDITRSEDSHDLVIRDINSDDEVYIHFNETETDEFIMSISYHLKQKDIEVGLRNYSDSGDSEFDTLFTHIIGKPDQKVDKIAEQVDFLKTAVNERKKEADKGVLDEPIELTFEVEEVQHDGKVSFEITTNLPDGAVGMIKLENKNIDYTGQDNFTVLDGKSKSGPFGQKNGALPSGEYEVAVTTPLATIQNDDVYSKIGEDYRNYIGDKFKEDDIGRSMNYRFVINLP